MDFLFSTADNSSVFRYGIPNFYRVSRSALDENSVIVGTPTAPPAPEVCEYIGRPVEGLNSANNEEPERGPDMMGEASKLPNPRVAVNESRSEKVHPPTREMAESSSSDMSSSDDSGPEEKMVFGADDFTDFMTNIGNKMFKKYVAKKGQKRKSSNHKSHHQSKKRKKGTEDYHHSRKRVSPKSNVKTISKK